MDNECIANWLKNIKEKYIHGGDEALDGTRKLAIDIAIERLRKQPPKKGHWVMKYRHRKSVKHVKGYDAYGVEREIELVEESEGYEPYCSECGAAAAESFLCFCPKCGADMRESLNKDGGQ